MADPIGDLERNNKVHSHALVETHKMEFDIHKTRDLRGLRVAERLRLRARSYAERFLMYRRVGLPSLAYIRTTPPYGQTYWTGPARRLVV